MLLAIDVGNSNTSVGLFDKDKTLRFLASLDTDSRKTADQISIDLMNLFTLYHFSYKDVTGAILCSVVRALRSYRREKQAGVPFNLRKTVRLLADGENLWTATH